MKFIELKVASPIVPSFPTLFNVDDILRISPLVGPGGASHCLMVTRKKDFSLDEDYESVIARIGSLTNS